MIINSNIYIYIYYIYIYLYVLAAFEFVSENFGFGPTCFVFYSGGIFIGGWILQAAQTLRIIYV